VVMDVSGWDQIGLDLSVWTWKGGSRIERFGFRTCRRGHGVSMKRAVLMSGHWSHGSSLKKPTSTQPLRLLTCSKTRLSGSSCSSKRNLHLNNCLIGVGGRAIRQNREFNMQSLDEPGESTTAPQGWRLWIQVKIQSINN